jgi:hypothetical protein
MMSAVRELVHDFLNLRAEWRGRDERREGGRTVCEVERHGEFERPAGPRNKCKRAQKSGRDPEEEGRAELMGKMRIQEMNPG